MGYFLAVTAFQNDSVDDVMAAITDFITSYQVKVESIPVESAPNPRRNAEIYTPVDGWTVVLWPEYFLFRTF